MREKVEKAYKIVENFIRMRKPKNYKFIGYIALYTLFILSVGMIMMGFENIIEYIKSIIILSLEFFFIIFAIIFVIILVFDAIEDILIVKERMSSSKGQVGRVWKYISKKAELMKKRELILSPKMQWWVLVIFEGIFLLLMFYESYPIKFIFENLNADNFTVYIYFD